MYRVVFSVCHLLGTTSALTNPLLYGYFNEVLRILFGSYFLILYEATSFQGFRQEFKKIISCQSTILPATLVSMLGANENSIQMRWTQSRGLHNYLNMTTLQLLWHQNQKRISLLAIPLNNSDEPWRTSMTLHTVLTIVGGETDCYFRARGRGYKIFWIFCDQIKYCWINFDRVQLSILCNLILKFWALPVDFILPLLSILYGRCNSLIMVT